MARTSRRVFSATYALVIMALGAVFLGGSFLDLSSSIDNWQEYIILIILGMISEWLVVPLPHGNLSVGFALVLATFLLYGTGPTIWVSTLSSIIANGIANRNNSILLTLFNGAQYAIAVTVAAVAYNMMDGVGPAQNPIVWANALPIISFIVTYFAVNHLLVNIYVSPELRHQNMAVWKACLRWDAITYGFAAPISILMVLLYRHSYPLGIKGVFLLFIPVLILKYLLRLYIDLDLANRQQAALYQVAKSLGSSLEIEDTLNVILEESLRVVKYHTGIIYLLKEDDGLLAPAAIRSPYSKQLQKLTVPMGEGVIGWAAKSGQPTIVYDSKSDAKLRLEPGVAQFLRSMLVLPLIADNKTIGVMVVGKKEVDGFAPEQMQILTILSAQAAVATAKSLLYRQIENLAITDGLTKLYNHRFFYKRIEEEASRATRYGNDLSLIMLDIDYFKRFNDTYGHKSGDVALSTVAAIIQSCVRSIDLVARYGGEEFAVLLPQTGQEGAAKIADRIRRTIKANPFEIDTKRGMVSVTVSVGVATLPHDAISFSDLIEAADKALYKAKNAGKDRVCLYQETRN